jgi:hypothetical protein
VVSGQISYPWYSIAEDDVLEQGDILLGFEIPDMENAFSSDSDDYEIVLQSLDVIILTQSCDLLHDKARSVVLCPVSSLSKFVAEAIQRGEQHWKKSDYLESLRQGNVPGFHLLSDYSSEAIEFPVSVVCFREIYSAPTTQVRDHASRCRPRLRLCPPYKEHLAQAFARFFMRVGLPVDIPREKLKSSTQ